MPLINELRNSLLPVQGAPACREPDGGLPPGLVQPPVALHRRQHRTERPASHLRHVQQGEETPATLKRRYYNFFYESKCAFIRHLINPNIYYFFHQMSGT